MKPTLFLAGCALALGAGLSAARATDPAPARAGRVLILHNEKTWTGDVELVGDRYRVRRLVGETWIEASAVLKVCATLDEAHVFMRRRANLHDPDERLRLADWCRQHGLYDAGIAEAEAAVAMKPHDAKVKYALAQARQAKTSAESPRAPAPPERPTPRIDVTADTLGAFASRVQPILMNACVNCHSNGRGGSFQLARNSSGLANRRSLDQNLAAVVAEINAAAPSSSRLLAKAVSVHAAGMPQAPLKGRATPAYQALENWVRLLVEDNPQLRETALAAAPPVPVPAATPVPPRPTTGQAFGEERQPAAAEAKRPEPPATKANDDPGDADGYNRQFHPGRKD